MIHPTMTVDTRDLDSVDILPMQLAITVTILSEMAVHTVHTFFEMDVLHMHRDASALLWGLGRFPHSALQERTIDRLKGDNGVFGIEKIALPVALENRLKIPAMAMVIGKLRVLELRVEFPDFGEEGLVRPQPTRSSLFGIVIQTLEHLGITGMFRFLGPHHLPICLVIPHLISQKRIHEDVRLMHMAHHTLAGRNGARQFVADGMTRLVFGDGGILGRAEATVAILRIRARIPWVAVIGIDRMASRTAARAVIARMVIRAQERQMRVIQTCFMDVQNGHTDAESRTQSAVTLPDVRLAITLLR